MSLPARERGLKHCYVVWDDSEYSSLPARERGLKLCEPLWLLKAGHVAPRAGAWIETLEISAEAVNLHGRSPRGSVD